MCLSFFSSFLPFFCFPLYTFLFPFLLLLRPLLPSRFAAVLLPFSFFFLYLNFSSLYSFLSSSLSSPSFFPFTSSSNNFLSLHFCLFLPRWRSSLVSWVYWRKKMLMVGEKKAREKNYLTCFGVLGWRNGGEGAVYGYSSWSCVVPCVSSGTLCGDGKPRRPPKSGNKGLFERKPAGRKNLATSVPSSETVTY